MYYMWEKYGTFPSDFKRHIDDEPGQLKVLRAFYEFRIEKEVSYAKNKVPGFVSV